MSSQVERPGAVTPGRDHVQSLERGLAVLKVFSAEDPELTLSDVARRCDLTRSAARRFLLTLVDLGYVGVDGRNFFLRPQVLELGYTYLSSLELPDLTRRHLMRLSAELLRSTSVAVLDRDDVVYVTRVAARRILAAGIGVGTRLPAYLTSHGRVLLAALTDEQLEGYLAGVVLEPRTRRTVTTSEALRREILLARKQGWSLVDQELEEGVSSVAAPLRDTDGVVVASVNVAVYGGAGAGTQLRKVALQPLLATAAAIEEHLRLAATSVDLRR